MTFPYQPTGLYARTYSVKGLGIATVISLCVAVAALLVAKLAPLAARGMAQAAQRDDNVELLNQAMLLDVLVVVPYFGALLTTAVLLIIWLYRARKNLDALLMPGCTPGIGSGGMLGAGWAIGGWFIPFANLVIPARVMSLVVRGSIPDNRGIAALVWLWWLPWLAGNCSDNVLVRFDEAESDALPVEISGPADYQAHIDYFGNEVINGLPGLIGQAVAGVVLAVLILRVSAVQHAQFAAAAPPQLLPGMAVAQPSHPGQPAQPNQPV